VKFENTDLSVVGEETVLACLLRHQYQVNYSCTSGHCQSCLLKMTDGDIRLAAQKGLKSTAVEQNFFLACQQPANSTQSACKIEQSTLFNQAQLIDKHFYNDSICRLRIACEQPFNYRAGQFINLKNPGGVIRSYSLASLPDEPYLELHVSKKNDGKMTLWLFEQFHVGDQIEFQGAIGDCFYTQCDLNTPITLIGNGTGASPLIGIVRDALKVGHRGTINFYHGASEPSSLYLSDDLMQMQRENNNFYYHPCINSEFEHQGVRLGRCNEIALAELKPTNEARLYLCGNPEMVAFTQKKAFLAGISSKNIFTDPFDYK